MMGKFKPQTFANTLWEPHFVSLDNFDDCTEQDISNLVWGFDKADVDNKQVFDKWIDAAIKRKDEFGKEGLENLMQRTK